MKDTLVAAYGRFNIFHQGHMLLVKKVKELAQSHNADAAIFLSHSYDKKNPLPYNDKVKFMEKWSNGIVKPDYENKIKQPMNILHYANEHGYKNVYLVCGDDRLQDYKKTFVDFSKSRDYFNFKMVDVLSRGSRDPDSEEDGASMSGTAMRKYVTDNDFNSFKESLPKECNEKEAIEVWKLARIGMKIKETKLVESNDKLKIAKIIGSSLGVENVDKLTSPEDIINKGLKKIKSIGVNKQILTYSNIIKMLIPEIYILVT